MRPFLLLLLSAALAGQESAILRVTTRTVPVSVVVSGKDGQPVAGLSRDDFTILEDGKPQEITSFAVEALRILGSDAEPLPPGFHTNRHELKGGAPSAVTVILFDFLNTRFRDKAYSRQELIRFLRTGLRPADRIALYALDSELHLLYDFTSDASGLITALDRYQPLAPGALDTVDQTSPTTGLAALDASIFKMEQTLADLNAESRVHRTTAALEAIANRVVALPGRKNLVWVTGGIPFSLGVKRRMYQNPMSRKRAQIPSAAGRNRNPLDVDPQEEPYVDYPAASKRIFDSEIQRAVRAMDAADLAVYPVDARGLAGMTSMDAQDRRSFELDRRRKVATAGSMPEEISASRETMTVLAERTGGRAFFDSNAIAGAIRSAIDETRFVYVLGYHPSHGRWDGHFQPVQVKVNRSGVTLRHRGGYVAVPESPAPAERQAGLWSAVASPLESTGIRLVVSTRPDVPSEGRLGVRTMIEVADLTLTRKDGHLVGRIDFAYLEEPAADGKKSKLTRDEISINLTQEAYEKALEEQLFVQKDLALDASAGRLRVIVRDQASGAMGSVDIRH
ncbi:MAG: VWA domain-containing protein [Acidobacteria bacterium]|nr:VWA domain-containing protein [Acidobacteriota bacterium]